MEPITYNGVAYTPQPMTVDQGDAAFGDYSSAKDGRKLNRAIVGATFSLTSETIGGMPWVLYQKMVAAALEVNGLTPQGEAQATGSL